MKKEMYMSRKKLLALALSAAVMVGGSVALVACKEKESGTDTAGNASGSGSGASAENSSGNGSENSGNAGTDVSSGTNSGASVELLKLTEKDQDTSYDEASAQKIELTDNCGKINITKEGTYIVSGSTSNGMLIINVGSEEDVHLILRDCTIKSETSAAIYIISADEVYITLEGNNVLTNGGSFTAIDSNDIDSVIYSKDDLTINGSGSVTITSPAGHGIVCKDDLVMTGGTYTISAKEDGINTNDSALFTEGVYTIDCKDDAIHTDGMLEFEGGTYTINAAEGLEGTYVMINDGDFTISASDDGINAGQKSDAYYPTVEINGGYVRITMASGDTDGIDANGNLYINGGTVDVTAEFPFDYDNEGKLNGGTVIVNGEEVSELSNQTFGPGGPGGGFQGGHGGKGGNGGQDFPGDWDGQMPDGMTPPEDWDGQMPDGMTPPDGKAPDFGDGQKPTRPTEQQGETA